jgi:hypothetical protein
MSRQFKSYLRGSQFTLRTDHKSLVWLNSLKDREGMMSHWMHLLQQFHFVIVHRTGRDHGNADGLSHILTSPCAQCSKQDCRQIVTTAAVPDQPFNSNSVGSSMDSDVLLVMSGEDWCALLDDNMSIKTLVSWIRADTFPLWTEVKHMISGYCAITVTTYFWMGPALVVKSKEINC